MGPPMIASARHRLCAAVVCGAGRWSMAAASAKSERSGAAGFCTSRAPDCAPLYPSLNLGRFLGFASAVSDDGKDVELSVTEKRDGTESGASCRIRERPVGHREAASYDEATTIEPESSGALGAADGATVADAQQKTPRSFVLSPELFNAAKVAEAGTPASFWTHMLYERAHPDGGGTEKVQVHYCTTKQATEQICQKHFLGHETLGLDLEWATNAKRTCGPRANVSLIQLASPERIGLFQVAAFPTTADDDDDLVAPTLKQILEDPAVRKAGVNIRGDCTRLRNNLGISVRGIFELSHLYKQVKYSAAGTPALINKSVVAMSVQAVEHLGLPLFKGDLVRTSDWQQPLNSSQILYAAADAYAGLKLFHEMDAKRRELTPCPPLPHYAELGLKIPFVVPDVEDELVLDDVGEAGHDAALADAVQDMSLADAAANMTKAEVSNDEVGVDTNDDMAPVNAIHQSVSAEASTSSAPSLPKSSTQSERLLTASPSSRDARIVEAERMAQQHRASTSTLPRARSSVSPTTILRTYYLWHANEDLGPESIARLLRNPPLKTCTVISYLLDALVDFGLPYSRQRVRDELLCSLHPTALLNGRFRLLVEACEIKAATA